MSYADALLDLSSVSVACLAGANGAGKSALLDAATWAIWEEARAASDDLVKLNEREMWIDLRFEHEGELYRIRRSRYKQPSKNGSKNQSKGTLDFQVSQNGSGWKTLTGANMRETQKLISELLRMDYDTFVNSAYLKQGRADEFTTRTPEKRKQVLSDILGLSYFDRLQEACKEKVRLLKQKKEVFDQLLIELPQSEEELTALTNEHHLKESELAKANALRSEHDQKISQLQKKLQHLSLVKHKVETGEVQLVQLQKDIQDISGQVNELNTRSATLSSLISAQKEIEAETGEYQTIKSKLELLDQNALAWQELNSGKVEIRMQLSDTRNRLELEQKQLAEKLQELESKKERLTQEITAASKIAEEFIAYRELLAKETELAQKQEAFTQISNRCAQLQSQIDEIRIHLEVDLNQKTTSLAEADSLLSAKSSLDQQKTNLEEEVEALEKLESEYQATKERGLEVKSTIESIQLKIENIKRGQSETEGKIKELQTCADSSVCPLCSSTIVDRAAVINRYNQSIDQANNEITLLEHECSKLETERNQLRQQYTILQERLETRKKLDSQIIKCNAEFLALGRASDSRDKLNNEIGSLKQKFAQNDYALVERESLLSLKKQLYELDFDPIFYNNLQAQIRAQRSIEARHHQLQKDLNELKQLENELPQWQDRLKELKHTLSEESYGKDDRKALENLDKQIADLNYDRDEHAKLKVKMVELLPFADKYRDLQRAVDERPNIELSLKNTQVTFATKNQQLELLKADLQNWRNELSELPAMQADFAQVEPLANQSLDQYNQLITELAVLKDRQNKLQTKIEELKLKRKNLKEIETTTKDYITLAEAFGKKGIQAVIIENAIPEIETEANRILSRLSESKMHIGLVTQLTNKTGNVVETLEILISDEAGTRNYELYSGGEAFKVNFALRVALSKLLARRAGAKLETLIIDEGFGSQDDLSRDRLVKAIRSIQEDFAKILVITHFSDVKEMFPTHIQVTKQNGSSRIQLLS